MTKNRPTNKERRAGWPGYQHSADYALDLFPGGWLAAMVWADFVAAVESDERFGQVASAYRRLDTTARSTASLAGICEAAGIEATTFVGRIVGYAGVSGADVRELIIDLATGPERLKGLIQIGMEPGGSGSHARIGLLFG